jgi:TRAP-type C4-dicarboxylate transport system permease small subunit
MKPHIIVATLLLIAGLAAIVYGGYWYIVENSASTRTVDVTMGHRGLSWPLWSGLLAVAAGLGILIADLRRRPLMRRPQIYHPRR